MEVIFFLDKFPARIEGDRVHYFLSNGEDKVLLNQYIGREVEMNFTGKLQCMDCKKLVKKFYAQGLCYVCTMSSPHNSDCIVRPELCEAHLGKGKVPEWEATHHNQPHIVYLANSGGIKVGVTRTDQIPTRWIDQGADEAVILARTPYRQLAGQIEVALKDYLNDKTNWRAMLKNIKNTAISLSNEKMKYAEILSDIMPNMEQYISNDDTIYTLEYPTNVLTQPIASIKLDKQPLLKGVLTGIKGQYMIWNDRTVLNVRSHTGYEVSMHISE